MKAYPAHIWKEDNGTYSVEFPDLRGCFSSGDTLEEAKKMAQEALTGYLESLDSRKLPVPEPSPIDTVIFSTIKNNVSAEEEYIEPITPALFRDIMTGMELSYTYWEADDGWFVGHFDDFPEHLTQGKNLEELEVMLKDLYDCLEFGKYHKPELIGTA